KEGKKSCKCVNKPDTKQSGALICGEKPGTPQCDGVCKTERKTGTEWTGSAEVYVPEALSLYLRAYLGAARRGGGEPEPTLLAKAKEIPLPRAWHEEIVSGVHHTLWTLLGADFLAPRSAPG